jgi:hypothetical protein
MSGRVINGKTVIEQMRSLPGCWKLIDGTVSLSELLVNIINKTDLSFIFYDDLFVAEATIDGHPISIYRQMSEDQDELCILVIDAFIEYKTRSVCYEIGKLASDKFDKERKRYAFKRKRHVCV